MEFPQRQLLPVKLPDAAVHCLSLPLLAMAGGWNYSVHAVLLQAHLLGVCEGQAL
jgi:hypothetical protein